MLSTKYLDESLASGYPPMYGKAQPFPEDAQLGLAAVMGFSQCLSKVGAGAEP